MTAPVPPFVAFIVVGSIAGPLSQSGSQGIVPVYLNLQFSVCDRTNTAVYPSAPVLQIALEYDDASGDSTRKLHDRAEDAALSLIAANLTGATADNVSFVWVS